MSTPREAMQRLIQGYQATQAVCIAAELGIADQLAGGPKGCDALAAATSTHAPALQRLLRALCSLGVFAQLEDGRYSLTPLSEYLKVDASASLRSWAIHSGRLLYDTWAQLPHSIATGDTTFDYLNGMDVWTFRELNPGTARIFHQAMAAGTIAVSRAVTRAYDFAKFATVADIGGGTGAFLQTILLANPHLKGILFDVEEAVTQAQPLLVETGVANRCASIGGSFFESVPKGADAYLLSRILHDWDDGRCIRILKNLRQAIGDGGTLLVIERVLDEAEPDADDSFSDLNMLVMTGGRERTASEYETLFAAACFRLSRVVPTDSHMKIVEALPIPQ